MKQIRSGVFETNSSSTHSFTIVDSINLLENGKLNWFKLKDKKISSSYDTGFVLVCTTYEEKISFLVYSVLNLYITDAQKTQLLDIIREETGWEIEFIDVSEEYNISSYSEDDDTYFLNETFENKITDLLELLKLAKTDKIFIKKLIEW